MTTTTWTLASYFNYDDVPHPFGAYEAPSMDSHSIPLAVVWLNLSTGAMIAAIPDASGYDGGGGCQYRIHYAAPGAQRPEHTIELDAWGDVKWNPRQPITSESDYRSEVRGRVIEHVNRRLTSGQITD